MKKSTSLYLAALACAWSVCLTAGLTVEEKLQQLTENYERLERKVQQQESLLNSLLLERPASHIINRAAGTERAAVVRTCREVRAADPFSTSGMYWIDPDGQGIGDDPIYVYCNMTFGSTLVPHDSESPMDVGHCPDPGCYSRLIKYNSTMRQMIALADLSSECHQSIKYDCNYAPLQLNDITYSWWNDRYGDNHTFWSGANSSVHTCQCGIDHDCAEVSLTCNCDSAAPVPLSDSGVISDKSFLPITRLNFGRTQLASSSGIHTLGRLECTGQVAVEGMPKSCTDLWRIGHYLSGLYSVMGTEQVENVFCDFTKLPTESGFERWIGQVDVKSSPVYFYVQRNSNFVTENVAVSFELQRLNIGGAMNLATGIFTSPQKGTYFFSISGIGTATLYPQLILNGSPIGGGISQTNWDTYSIQSTLQLRAADRVWIQLKTDGSGYLHDNGNQYTHFTGWLLHEDLSY